MEHLRKISEAYKANGVTSMSLTQVASKAILLIPIPDGTKEFLDPVPCEEEK